MSVIHVLLKSEFPWEDIEEERRSECEVGIGIIYLGENVVLNQNKSNKIRDITKDLDEWFQHWFI